MPLPASDPSIEATPAATETLRGGTDARRGLALSLMLASGFAGLGYQIVWTQQSTLWLGHESAAVLAVVAAFFGGLSLGALAFGPRIECSPQPLRWYAGCELVVALWSLALAFALPTVADTVLTLTGAQPTPLWQWTLAFSSTFLLLLPATAAMGATLPALERATVGWGRHRGRSVAALYAGNTLGAVLGVLATAFWLLPEFGLLRTAGVCAALNLACAAAASVLLADASTAEPPTASPTAAPARRLQIVLAATGLLGIGYEVLAVRVLGQLNEGTVYTYALLLAVYLVGSAAGAALYQRSVSRRGMQAIADTLQDRLLLALAAACLLGTLGLYAAGAAKALLRQTLGSGLPAALGTEAGLAILVFALPTVAMGALFAQLGNRALASGLGFGRALGLNTMGAAAAPLLFGLVAVPAWGPKAALLLIAAGYLALTARPTWRSKPALAACAALAIAALWAPPLAFVELPEGGRIVSYREGALAAVSVVEDADGVSRLRIDNRQQEGSSATRLFDARQALLPLLLHPAPQRALFLGLGTGVTASSAAADPNLEVDAVELLPEVIEASAHFRRELPGGADNPRLHLLAADARRFVRATDRRYSLIVADNFHPARSGSGALYTVEHFQAVRARLSADGMFCQWLPLHQLDLATLRSIVRSFVAIYPGGWAMLANNSLETPVVGLVGRADGGRFDAQQVRNRVSELAAPLALADFGLVDEFAVLGGFIAGPASLAQFAEGADLNTDDRPVVAYRAPRIAYAPDTTPASRLLALLQASRIAPGEPISPTTDAALASRLAAYWQARDSFIALGQGMHPSADVRQMLQQVQAPLLAVLRTSPDFRPAYDPLLRMARALVRTDADAARALLDELARVQPARPEAALALRELGGAGR